MWGWLTKPETPYTWGFALRVLAKALLLFAAFNLLFAAVFPLSALGRLSLYNGLIPGRPRLPYGENPAQSYNLSLQNLEALLAAHLISGASKRPDEYRVLLIGDSATWGVLLDPGQTLAGFLNADGLRTPDGRRVEVYNLGYPVQSLLKDVLILSEALRYRPDLIVWPFTLESFAPTQQMATRLVQENPEPVRRLIGRFGMRTPLNDPRFIEPDLLGRTLVGQRRALADWLRLQLYGVAWANTQIDQVYPRFYEPRREDFAADTTWAGREAGPLSIDQIAFDALRAGLNVAGGAGVPVLLIHEPMFISQGQNSHIRYNFFYPRWAVDDFRALMSEQATANGWLYLDWWDVIAASEFTDSAVHLTPRGSRQFASLLGPAILRIAEGGVNARAIGPGGR